MQIVTATIARTVEECWRVFVNPAEMPAWVPGLRDVRLIESRADGLPLEIQFEFGAGELIYSLIYTYDVADRVVRWEPRGNDHGAVRGFAQLEPFAGGSGDASKLTYTKVTYALEHDTHRKAAERMLDAPKTNLAAFVRYMEGS